MEHWVEVITADGGRDLYHSRDYPEVHSFHLRISPVDQPSAEINIPLSNIRSWKVELA